MPLPLQIPCFNLVLVIFATAVILLHSKIEDGDNKESNEIHEAAIPLEIIENMKSFDKYRLKFDKMSHSKQHLPNLIMKNVKIRHLFPFHYFFSLLSIGQKK